jgi:putative ABC transport system substrate-binding protein
MNAMLTEQCGANVHKILHGATPSDLPVEFPTRLRMVVNLKVAQALGITSPPALLFQADEVTAGPRSSDRPLGLHQTPKN